MSNTESGHKARQVDTLAKLRKAGAFVAEKPFPAAVEWGGETIPLYVRQLGVGALHEIATAVHGEHRSYAASIIEAAVCFDPGGNEPFAFEDAYQLVPALMEKVLAEVNRVNGGLTDGR